jgi:hypothetical protein
MLQDETSSGVGGFMVQLTRREPVPEYQILDPRGMPIGRVVDPEGPPRLGPGGATVLLLR